ncbi:NADPH:quinone reductase-like Zn-dependent oxidoreductase [Sphingobium sp. OAS761]|uniref:quinone oxidoreductase family protein n=1 Tax=Sphingobium sp. OAS761 TaxID=2817901 RepID=UPI00209DAFFA|nr:NADP-dependent oxidoreductase [Sphingobium sp. OAS761]MCP1471723.1 NADPH:quinone reductase-like Zn-dependent oxidoreductase [Sphingobium sp. OAS761]
MTVQAALPATMQAMALDGFAGPGSIRLRELPVPVAQAGEVLVKVAAVGVNPADWKACAGFLPFLPVSWLPLVPGFDGTGTVVSLGEDVTQLKIGDRVAFMSGLPLGRGGTWSEYAICPAGLAACLPDALSFTAAATIPVAGISPREALDQGGLKAGEQVLINGGSGGTGIWAIQIARNAGAQVAATAGPANQDLLNILGVARPIDYRNEDVAARVADWAPGGVDLLLDTVGQGSLGDPAALIRPGGRYVAIETMLPDETTPGSDAFDAKGIRAIRASASFPRLGAHLAALVDAVASGKMQVPPVEIMPLADAAKAMGRVRDGHVRGKIVLTVQEDQEGAANAPATVKDFA